jgi:hypothetical protein
MTMRRPDLDRLYALLPAVDRINDAALGEPLRALLRIISAQAELLRVDVQGLWDNFFIETSDRWAVPYIGELIGNRALHDVDFGGASATAEQLFTDLAGPTLRPVSSIRTRADVAKTIAYRRRKGTPAMLEELAGDVTGWAAHVVEFFTELAWLQNVNHVRPQSTGCFDLRSVEACDRAAGPFDPASHLVDVRPFGAGEGWYGVPNIGFFLWRLRDFGAVRVQPRLIAVKPNRMTFSPLGNSAPLFERWTSAAAAAALEHATAADPVATPFVTTAATPIAAGALTATIVVDAAGGGDAGAAWDIALEKSLLIGTGAVQEPAVVTGVAGTTVTLRFPPGGAAFAHAGLYAVSGFAYHPGARSATSNVPAPIPVALYDDQPELFYGNSLEIRDKDGHVVPASLVSCRNLRRWSTFPAGPPASAIWIDVARGRMMLGSGYKPADVTVTYRYGFSAEMGGGDYDRSKWAIRFDPATVVIPVDGVVVKLDDALATWQANSANNTIVRILTSGDHPLTKPLDLDPGHWLAIEAANGARPHLLPASGDPNVGEAILVKGAAPGSALTLSGLLVEGGVRIEQDVQALRLLHTTLVPGRHVVEEAAPPADRRAIVVSSGSDPAKPINAGLRVEIAFSIVGPIVVPSDVDGLWLLDSIVDGAGGAAVADANGTYGPVATIERSTLIGPSSFKQLTYGSESIFAGAVQVERHVVGCVRFSFVPLGSSTPRQYRCQPALEMAAHPNPAEAAAVGAALVPSFESVRYGDPTYAQLRLTAPVQIRQGAEDGSEMGAFNHLKQPQRETNLRIRLDEYLPFGLTAGFLYVPCPIPDRS